MTRSDLLPRLGRRVSNLIHESKRASSKGSGFGSKLRLGTGPTAERTLRHLRITAPSQRLRTVRIGSLKVQFRLNAGDIQGIREVLVDEAYRLPFDICPRTIVDLGANIGLTSLYYRNQFPGAFIVAIEPDPDNAKIARRNLAATGSHVVEAAVGLTSDRVRFRVSAESNLGQVDSTAALEVQGITMDEILDLLPGGRADLVKIDIEGGEGALFSAKCTWLDRVDAIIIELHPQAVDPPRIVEKIESAGLRYVPASSAWFGSMDAFVRTETVD